MNKPGAVMYPVFYFLLFTFDLTSESPIFHSAPLPVKA